MLATFQLSAYIGYHAEFHEGCYQKHTNPLNCRTSGSHICGYHADFHEGHGTVGEWQGCGMAWHGMAGKRHVCGMACVNNKGFLPVLGLVSVGFIFTASLNKARKYNR
jgi:hypothetical protein